MHVSAAEIRRTCCCRAGRCRKPCSARSGHKRGADATGSRMLPRSHQPAVGCCGSELRRKRMPWAENAGRDTPVMNSMQELCPDGGRRHQRGDLPATKLQRNQRATQGYTGVSVRAALKSSSSRCGKRFPPPYTIRTVLVVNLASPDSLSVHRRLSAVRYVRYLDFGYSKAAREL